MPCILSAENSGFYGSVGFQYSNMTKAVGSNMPYGFTPAGVDIANPFLNATGTMNSNDSTLPNQTTVTAGSHAGQKMNLNFPNP